MSDWSYSQREQILRYLGRIADAAQTAAKAYADKVEYDTQPSQTEWPREPRNPGPSR